MIIHKNYNKPREEDNDIALIKLSRPLTFDKNVRPIRLASKEYQLKKGKILDVSGWGATREGGSGVKHLFHVQVSFLPNEKCNDTLSYDGKVTNTMICFGGIKGKEDSCNGDSGGPLIEKINNDVFQVGIVSWGKGCGRAGKPGIYADARLFGDWERQCIKDPENCKPL